MPLPSSNIHRNTSNQFNGKQAQFFYSAPITGCIIGAAAGHWLHDFGGKQYINRHGGKIDPEARLYIIYGASFITGLSILLLCVGLQNKWHYMAIVVVDALQLIGANIISTAVNAYLLDAYAEAAGEVDVWIVMGRTFGGFMATYVEIGWAEQSGAASALGAQAGITWAAAVVFIVFLQAFGKRTRRWQGPMRFPGQAWQSGLRPRV